MNDWKEYELGNICSRLSSGKGIKAAMISDSAEYAVYGGNGIRGYTSDYNFEGDCAIIGRQGAYCGNVRFFSGKAYMTEHAVIACANSEHNTRYLSYVLTAMNLGRLSGQSAQPGISVKTLSIQKVQMPPLDIQSKIVAVISSLEEKIELNTAINENLEQQVQALFKNLIADIQERVPFTSVIQVLGGGTPKTGKQEYWNGEIPFFTPKDVGTPYVLTTEKSITPLGLDNCNSRLYPVNTVFLTARGTVGKVSLAGVPMSMNQSCYALAGKDGLHQIIVYHYVLETVKALKHKASGAVFDAIITRDFDTESVPALSSEQIESFIAVAEPIYSDILNRTIENQRLAALRDTLLPKLMNGEIDVSEVKI